MSGGSLDYAYLKVEDIAAHVKSRAERPLHRAFADHLVLVAKALQNLEWVWSNDYGPGDEDAALLKCLPHNAPVTAAVAGVRAAMMALCDELERAK